jgi:hypothetical protein
VLTPGEGGRGWIVQYSRKLSIWFDKPKYRVEMRSLDPKKDPSAASAILVICDGTSIACKEISSHIHPHKEQTRVVAADHEGLAALPIGDYPFLPPGDLGYFVKNPGSFGKAVPPAEFVMTESGVEGRCAMPSSAIEMTMTFPREFQYNIADFNLERKSNGYRQWAKADWAKNDETWYVKQIEVGRTMVARRRQGAPKETAPDTRAKRLTYASFEANAKVDSALFRLASLEIKTGAQVVELPEGQDKLISHYKTAERDDAAATESLREAVAKLPTRMPPAGPRPGGRAWVRRVALLGTAGLFTAGGVAVYLYRRRARPAAGA